MRCKYCKDNMGDGTTSYMVDRNNHAMIIRGVPCIKCDQCGHEILMDDVGKTLRKMTKIIMGRDEEVSITTYDEMLKQI